MTLEDAAKAIKAAQDLLDDALRAVEATQTQIGWDHADDPDILRANASLETAATQLRIATNAIGGVFGTAPSLSRAQGYLGLAARKAASTSETKH